MIIIIRPYILMVEDTRYLQSLGSEQMVGHMIWAASYGDKACWPQPSALGHLGYGVNSCWPQTVVQNHFVENVVRQRLMWAETSIGTKELLYVCVYKEKLESMFEQWLYRPTQAVVVVVFLHDKVFFQFLLRTPRFHFTLSLSWISLSVIYLS